ncbi:type II toxin-antitoxin system VapB family antitoxin [Methylobacterium gregans]|uniref:type II toxin-antitoxin system VapB family antitoxin n=1 Tax=Methylobacterium gregans TaxID=374424 RepID=UPI0036092FE5
MAFDVYAVERLVPPNISEEVANRSADKLAPTAKLSKAEAVRRALVHDRWREARCVPPAERLQPVLDEIAAAPKPGQEADKAFDDDLSGDP